MSRYRIRPADGAADGELLHELDRILFPGNEAPKLTEAELLNGWWWIAIDRRGRAVGYAGLTHLHGTTGYLARAGVLPEHRGHGLQRRFIRVRERKARALGYTELVSDTHKRVFSANNLIAAGFRLFEPKRPWAFATTLYWRKHL